MEITKSPFGTLIDVSSAALNLYKYGRRPFITFSVSIVLTIFMLQLLSTFKFVSGINPPNPEWKEALSQLQTRCMFLFRNLIYCGSFVLGVSQAIKKQQDIFNPDLGPVYLYGKLLVVLLLAEFICNILLQPKKIEKKGYDENKNSPILNVILSFIRNISREISEQMISGASIGFGYGYLIRGVGVLFQKY